MNQRELELEERLARLEASTQDECERLIHRAVVTGWVFVAIYAVIGFFVLVASTQIVGTDNQNVMLFQGLWILATAALFMVGCFKANNGNTGAASKLWKTGGIMGFPLGLVMFFLAMGMNKAVKKREATSGTHSMAYGSLGLNQPYKEEEEHEHELVR